MTSLYAAYACNEGAGTVITDYSGNSRNMTVSGTGNTWVTGHGSYPLAFLGGTSGTAGAQWDNGSADATLSGDVTVMCWAQSSNGATGQSFAAGLYSAVGTARLAMYSYRSLNATAASPELTLRNSGGGLFSLGVNGTTADAAWHHIAAVYHSAATVDIYLDGTAVVTGANVSSAIGTTVRFLGAGSLLAGAGANSAVQDFRVFSSALAGTDITTYMNTPVTTVTGSGGLAAKKAVTAGTGLETFSGSGSAAAKKPLAAGTGSEAFAGSGSVARRKPSASGAGAYSVAGSGGVAASKAAVAGTGTAGAPPPFSVGVLTASTYAPSGTSATSSGINTSSTSP
ncbi:MAG TPA: LamG-like jellyroll fold domain-containing protein [Amycolatopsis sp.]|jgi:hypothetical protein